jgi:hypothetical protein
LTFHSGETFQGLMPYYFQVLNPNRSLALNYCKWNDNNFGPKEECNQNEENCEDCRVRPIEAIGLIHFTACYKPWWCWFHGNDDLFSNQCRLLIHEWYKARSEMETTWGRSGTGKGAFEKDIFLGFCNQFGQDGYQLIKLPF